MKKILLSLLGLIAAVQVASAAQQSTTVTTAVSATNAILNGQIVISEVAVANATAVTLTVDLYDAYNATNLTYVVPAFTNMLSYQTNLVTTFTNISGVVQSSTNSVVYSVSNTVASVTNNYQKLVTIAVPAGTTTTYTPLNGLITSFGLSSRVNTNATITTTYSNLR